METNNWMVYLVRCADNSLYCGVTNDLKKRLAAHNSGRGAKYTRPRRPVKLVGISQPMTKSDALKLEYRVKRVPACYKQVELSMEGGATMWKLKQDLQAVNKEFKSLLKKVEKLIVSIDHRSRPAK